jgi:hypothetical protein
MSKRVGNIIIIEVEPDDICELCGKKRRIKALWPER